ncbi:NTE family protein [Branchiibius hedensis]|uniref:NTE family protein n=1 Tax=Branchiibius hedensis TaxID=672460 RepID=A0A2Y8ZQM5_9MICO|nr:patatin-like phospholipase family protein [Branchiibius hedensis]PWJ25412.1 NTE family protein [Branchiibius hedensis]SSA34225.1 NTE family protein [Branchiibius hedensis]
MKTAFVLGGGGLLGATQIGGMRALLESGVHPDLVVGTSIGAINGAHIAFSPTVETLDALAEHWVRLSSARSLRDFRTVAPTDPGAERPRRFGRRRIGLRRPSYLYPAGPFLRMLRSTLPTQTFDNLELPFQCVAASVERAVAQWFTSGPLAEAVMASCSVPGLFPPFRIGDEHYYDGGLVHSIPIGRAIALGATRIYVLHVGRVEQPLEPPEWPWEVGTVAFEIARRHRYMEEIAETPADIELHVMPSGTDDAPMVSLLHLNTEFVTGRIDAAHRAALSYLEQER